MFTSSFAGMVGNAFLGPYSVAKFGVVALAEGLSRELKSEGIGVSVLCPMIVDTPLMANSERSRSGDYGARSQQKDDAVQGLTTVVTPTDDNVQADDVARLTADAVVANRLYILPHRAVAGVYSAAVRTDRPHLRRAGRRGLDSLTRSNREPAVNPSGCMEPFDGRTGWGMKRLNGMDAMLLYSETPNLHTHTLKVRDRQRRRLRR